MTVRISSMALPTAALAAGNFAASPAPCVSLQGVVFVA